MNMEYFWWIVIVIVLIAVFLYLENTLLSTSNYQIHSNKIPQEFDGLNIVLLSDIHNTKNNVLKNNIIKYLKKQNPDCIMIAGDLFDSRRTNVQVALDFSKQLTAIAPVYFVTGNHEGRKPQHLKQLEEGLKELSVTILHDECFKLLKNDYHINLIGMDDPRVFGYDTSYEECRNFIFDKLVNLVDRDSFNLLLIHRPELFDVYVKAGCELILTGHAHGGQIRLPFIGGLFAPGQGVFPKLTSGLYQKEASQMIVSRGIGNSNFPFRVFNHPEIISIELKKDRT